MFRFSISEKYLCFIPALLLTSQIFYRIFFLQTSGASEVSAFAVIPAVFAALALGIFLCRKKWNTLNRFLLHTGFFAILVCSTLIPPTLLNGAELILLGILAGMVFAGVPDNRGIITPVLLGVIAAGLLFFPSRPVIRYLNFILLPLAQFCLLCAYFAAGTRGRQRIITGIPLFLSLVVLIIVSGLLLKNREQNSRISFQQQHRLQPIQQEQYFISLLAALCQEKRTDDTPVRITVIEHEPLPVSRLLSPLKKYGFSAEIRNIFPDLSQNSQRLLPFLKPDFFAPAEIHEFIGETDLIFVSPPIPTERSAAFLSTATFFRQIFDRLPANGVLAVYAGGTEEQNRTIYNSMPSPVKDKEGKLTGRTAWLPMGSGALFLCRKDRKDPLLDSAQLAENLPPALAGYKDVMQLVFPALVSNEFPIQDTTLANRPFHPILLQQKNPPSRTAFLHFLVRWHGIVLAALIGIYLLLRYFISWKPVQKPCFKAFETGLLVMLLLAGSVLVGTAMGCGPFFSLLPALATVFCATCLFLSAAAAKEKWNKYQCLPLLLVIALILLGWNLPAAAAMIAAMTLKAFLNRETPELAPELQVYPKVWLFVGMAVALIAAGLFPVLPI